MRLITLTVENFRCYAMPFSVRFNDITTLIGQNDVGKSTIMDALAIFFETAKPDKDDACKSGDPKTMRITCEFGDLPDTLVVDTTHPTSLSKEYLLSPDQTLVVQKTYNGSLTIPKITSIKALAQHPTSENYNNLLELKQNDLKNRATKLGVNLDAVDERVKAQIRDAIWNSCEDLNLKLTSVPLEAEGSKQIWTALLPYLPAFALFKSDRASTDQDAEAQDPLKSAIREAVKTVESKLEEVKQHVESEVRKIATATVKKMREMDPSIAETLNPIISTKKWETLFTTSITGDEDIPLNKRGSGVRRLVLLNFFRAQAENEATAKNTSSVIYAIEEPETSQHPKNQRLLLSALRELSLGQGRQVVLTTHTPMLAKLLAEDTLRFIQRDIEGNRTLIEGGGEVSELIAKSLGILPDHNVKAFIGVEGPHDINFLKGITKILIAAGETVPDLEALELEGQVIFFPFGGSNLALWSSRLKHLNRPEFHICDRDVAPPKPAKYQQHVDEVNARDECSAVVTTKREMENFLHSSAICEAYNQIGVNISLPDSFEDFDDVPTIVAKAVHSASGGSPWTELTDDKRSKKEKRAKQLLNGIVLTYMTIDRLNQCDPNRELLGWLNKISAMITKAD